MIEKPLDDINASDVRALIEENEAERKTLEYKRQLPGDTPSDKDKLRKTATSLANTAGGDLVFGIAESDEGLTLHGIEDVSEDDALLRILGALQYNIEPKLPPPPHRLIVMPDGERVLVVRIARSWRGPHFVKNDTNYRMYGRHSKGRFQMDASEMRHAIMASEGLIPRMERWRHDRIRIIQEARTPVPLYEAPTIVMHALPLETTTDPFRLDAATLNAAMRDDRIQTLGEWSSDRRINLEGVVSYSRAMGVQDIGGYTRYCQASRSGRIEWVWQNMQEPRREIRSSYEAAVVETLSLAFNTMKSLGIDAPWIVSLSLLGVSKCTLRIVLRGIFPDPKPIERDELLLPPVVFDAWPTDRHAVVRPMFDGVWNACGLERSFNYDREGNWLGAAVDGLSGR